MELSEQLKWIKLLILDVDGVLTNGSVILGSNDTEQKCFDIKDGLGIRMLISAGIVVSIITGRKSDAVTRRAAELGIVDLYQGTTHKLRAYDELLEKYDVHDEETAYMGDDLFDIPLMNRVGLPIAVADAVDEVKDIAAYTTRKCGGSGAVREVTDMILKNQDLWNKVVKDLGIYEK